MNLSPSSSFSSSVTTISSNNSHDFTPKPPTVRCLVDILRRMLCSRNLPTHPSDQATESSPGEGIMICKDDPDSTPGIVARLMGLDSLPESSVSKIGRSRSASYVVKSRGEEKTVKSSQSFREIPKYVELQDDEFFILSFERGSEIKELRSRSRKLKKRREKKAETEENRADQRDSCRGADVEPEGNVEGYSRAGEYDGIDHKVKLERKSCLRIKQVEAECSSDDLSPVSVLDHSEFIRDPAATSSDDSCSDSSKSRSSANPRRKLSTELQTEDQSPIREGRNSMDDDPQQKIREGSMKKEFHSEEFSEILSDVRKILGREIVESNWAQKGLWRIEECEGIGSELEAEILDHLLDEVLDDQFS